MNENNFDEYIGKKVFVVLKTGIIYNGLVKEVTDNFIFISDKFNKPVTISIADISSLGEKQ